MDFDNRFRVSSETNIFEKAEIDEALRSYMLSIYNYMTAGMLITAFVSYFLFATGTISYLYTINAQGIPSLSILGWLSVLAPFAAVMYFNYALATAPINSVKVAFFVYSAFIGISLSPLLLVYTGISIVRVFLITSCMFAGMSIYGYTTKRNLIAMQSFLYMGLWGLIIASLVNIFFKSSGMNFALSVIGVLLFTVLTAFDTQKIKMIYYRGDNIDSRTRKAIYGALELYMDFINMFIYLLRFFGERK